MALESHVVQVDPGGRLALTQAFLSSVGLHKGDRVVVFPLKPGLVYLRKVDAPKPPSREELSALMRAAFASSGYITREQVLALVRETKRELVQEW